MTERSPVDEHFDLVVDQRAEEKLRRALALLNGSSVQILVHFGVAAIGSKGVLYTRTPQHVAREATEAL